MTYIVSPCIPNLISVPVCCQYVGWLVGWLVGGSKKWILVAQKANLREGLFCPICQMNCKFAAVGSKGMLHKN